MRFPRMPFTPAEIGEFYKFAGRKLNLWRKRKKGLSYLPGTVYVESESAKKPEFIWRITRGCIGSFEINDDGLVYLAGNNYLLPGQAKTTAHVSESSHLEKLPESVLEDYRKRDEYLVRAGIRSPD